MYPLNPDLLLLPESEVSISSTPKSSESLESSDSDRFTTVSSYASTKPQPTYFVELSHTSLSDILQEILSESLFSREDMERSMDKESLFLITELLRNLWVSITFSPLRIWSMKSTLLELTSRKLTTSYGPSNLEDPEEDSPPRDIPSKDVEIGETEKNISTNLSTKCSDYLTII